MGRGHDSKQLVVVEGWSGCATLVTTSESDRWNVIRHHN
jgi:hypothetical protein